MKYYSVEKPEKCPACGSLRIVTFLYGEPAFSKELMAEINVGKVMLGGCCIAGYDPDWECLDCKAEIFQKNLSSTNRL
jgi:hypothetical protein